MKNMFPRFVSLLILGMLILNGCDVQSGPTVEQATVHIAAPSPEKAPTPRFTVVIVGEFDDALAYSGKRRIYEITDHKYKRTYLSATGLSLDRMQKDADDEAAAEAAEAVVDTISAFSD